MEIVKSDTTALQLEENLKGVSVEFKFRGGAKPSFLWEPLPKPYYDIIVITLRSSNLSSNVHRSVLIV